MRQSKKPKKLNNEKNYHLCFWAEEACRPPNRPEKTPKSSLTNSIIMAYYEFTASRVSGDGNAIFPDKIIIDTYREVVIHRKTRVIGYKETKIRFGAIGSVTVNKHLLFADVIIESNGGQVIRACGFTRSDANDIADLLR